MTRLTPLVMIILLAGCATGTEPPASQATTASQAATTAAPETSPSSTKDAWIVPTQQVQVKHDVAVPPLPVLVEVRAGDHAGDGYERVTFAFRGAFPAYTFQIVDKVVRDGSGATVTLPGAAFLRIVFTPARSDATTGPQNVGFRRLKAYEQVGNYEGYVSYGLGIDGTAPQVRTSELTRPDGTNVVALDIKT